LVADEAMRWLDEERLTGDPFFLYVCFHEPHEPVASPPGLVSQYPEAINTDQAQYFANVTNMDRAVGRLLEKLDELRIADNTLVYFSSDNGPETLKRYKAGSRSYGSPGPLRGMKLWLYEAGMRVPGIIRWPARVKPGQTISEPIASLDLLPTCCALAGVATPTDRALDGANIASLFDGVPPQRAVPLFWHYYRSLGEPKAALRDGDWVVLGHWDQQLVGAGRSIQPGDSEIIKKSHLTKFELYNLKDDIGQKHDLAEAEPARLKKMSQDLVAKYEEVIDEGPVWTGFDPPKATPNKTTNSK
jgi:arylsulfatase A